MVLIGLLKVCFMMVFSWTLFKTKHNIDVNTKSGVVLSGGTQHTIDVSTANTINVNPIEAKLNIEFGEKETDLIVIEYEGNNVRTFDVKKKSAGFEIYVEKKVNGSYSFDKLEWIFSTNSLNIIPDAIPDATKENIFFSHYEAGNFGLFHYKNGKIIQTKVFFLEKYDDEFCRVPSKTCSIKDIINIDGHGLCQFERVIPILKSAHDKGFEITCSGVWPDSKHDCFMAFTNEELGWVSNNSPTPNHWIEIKFPKAVKVNVLVLQARREWFVETSPYMFSILGSTDGISYVTLGDFKLTWATLGEEKRLYFKNDSPYIRYQLRFFSRQPHSKHENIAVGKINLGKI